MNFYCDKIIVAVFGCWVPRSQSTCEIFLDQIHFYEGLKWISLVNRLSVYLEAKHSAVIIMKLLCVFRI